MPSSRFTYPIDPSPPSLPATASSRPVNCTGALDGAACRHTETSIMSLVVAAVFLPLFACVLLCACYKLFAACYCEPAAPHHEQQDLPQEEAAQTKGEVAMTAGQLDDVKLVILPGGDKPSILAVPCVAQGHVGSAADSETWLEKTNDNRMAVR